MDVCRRHYFAGPAGPFTGRSKIELLGTIKRLAADGETLIRMRSQDGLAQVEEYLCLAIKSLQEMGG